MYLDFLIEVPEVPGKITYRVKKETSYVMYEYDRTYDAEKQITYPKRATIGKLSSKDNKLMQPNQNFLKYFKAFGFTEKTGFDLPGEAVGAFRPEDNFTALSYSLPQLL